ncbi:MAG: hypothetical protein U9R57_02440 [Thermodesulfobacteriota bacterium]|nr:hypothetical protein [Thermodesulfobacteriota bacterium]
MLSKKILYSVLFIILVLVTGISTQASIIVPQIMLLLNDSGVQQEAVSVTYDEVKLDMVRLE